MPVTETRPRAAPAFPSSIGRFQVLRVLGRGAQGIVYLAEDPELHRLVAIKTLRRHRASPGALITEARSAGRLKHPNIVPVYDIGEHRGAPYVVYEYVEGRSLRDVLKERAPLPPDEAVHIARQIADAIAYAHDEGIVHRDLNPNNICIERNGSARVMDFGIATMSGAEVTPGGPIWGTVSYMAPEQIQGGRLGPATDIFQLGLIVYEMLTNQCAVRADEPAAALYQLVHERLRPPSARNPEVDDRLDAIVLKALEVEPEQRFASARELGEALVRAIEPESGEAKGADGNASTLGFLLRRMRRHPDFPALSERITEISRKTSSLESASLSELANAVLKDYALTTKLLKLVNSSFYSQYGGRISTVSRAVVILGFKQVRMAAQSLILFEHLHNKPQAKQLREAASQAVLSGIIARHLADRMGLAEPEEAFVCAMVHRLGRYLTLYHLPEEHTEIAHLMEHRGLDEATACRSVLGLTFEEIGIGIAREWHLPDTIIDSMRVLPEGPVRPPRGRREALRQVSAFATELCDALTGDTRHDVAELQARFDSSLPIRGEKLLAVLEHALEDAKLYGTVIGSDLEASQVFQSVKRWALERGEAKQGSWAARGPAEASEGEDGEQSEDNTALINGLQDITHALVENYDLNDILSMVLETVYRGIGLTRVILCIADRKNARMTGRYGLGRDIDRILERFRFPLHSAFDPFSRAAKEGRDLVLRPGVRSDDLPEWHRKLLSAHTVILLPITVKGVCVGAIYCDLDEPKRSITPTQFNYLNALRNQATLALKRS